MVGNPFIPTLDDYRKEAGNVVSKTNEKPESAIALPSLQQYARSTNSEKPTSPIQLSPIHSGKAANVNPHSRSNALSFAHPVDASIIRSLDNAAINTVFNKAVQASIDASFGLTLATGIHISPDTYPEIYKIITECAEELGIPIPYVIISDQVSGINAVTAGTDRFSFIAVSSLLPVVLKPDELRFVIGHECGHLALGHVVYHTAISLLGTAGGLLPLVGNIIAKTVTYPLNAWSRRSEVSADRAGLICCRDVRIAQRTLLKLTAGLLNTDSVDIDAYVHESEQILEASSIGKYAEFSRQHPIIPKRIKALDLFSKSEVYYKASGMPVPQNVQLISVGELQQQIENVIGVI